MHSLLLQFPPFKGYLLSGECSYDICFSILWDAGNCESLGNFTSWLEFSRDVAGITSFDARARLES